MPTHSLKPTDIERTATGIPGFDEILGGGFPARHMYLIEGEAGAGKTTLGLHFILEGRRKGENTLWITLSETERELQDTARSHGWLLDGVEILNLVVSDDMFKAEGQYSFFSPADVELNETTKSILQAIERHKPTRVVFDPFSDIKLLARDALRYRRQVLTFREFLAVQGCTAILMQEATRGQPGDIQAEALVHGYMTLHLDAPDYGGQRRRLRVHKMRGIPFRDGFHDFSIKTGGIDVYPRLVAAEHLEDLPDELVSSGVPALNDLLGGGIDRGTSLLIMGPAGVGKSTLATSFATAAAARGEKAAIFIFDETVRAFRTRGNKLGLNVSRYQDEGSLSIRRIEAAEFSPGQFAHLLMDRVEKEKANVVVIDSLSGYLSAMPEERFLTTHLHELLTYLSHKNVVTILTLPQHGVVGESVVAPVDVSYLADDVLLLRYFEAFGAVRRAISVVKKRTGPHQVHIREMSIGQSGIDIGEQLMEFQGVLTGRPEFIGKAAELSSNISK
ncbi:MAG: AAA family ATPase [Gemmataceae bacterium]|nr:AAA family ATPase [Gemmataceae bacterium]